MTPPTNIPAFPSNIANSMDSLRAGLYQGMTLRDYFAGQALPQIMLEEMSMERATTLIGKSLDTYSADRDWPCVVAKLAYRYADAMLKQREVKDESPN